MIGMNPPKNASAAGHRQRHTDDHEPEPDEEPVDQADEHLGPDEAAEGVPDPARHDAQVATGAGSNDPAHPGQEPVAVLDEEEGEHDREQGGGHEPGEGAHPGEHARGDGGDAALQLVVT